MSVILIVKDGLDDYEICVHTIENNFSSIDNLEAKITTALASNGWQGKSHERCQDLFSLTSKYKDMIKEIFEHMSQNEKGLVNNINDFCKNSSSVGGL